MSGLPHPTRSHACITQLLHTTALHTILWDRTMPLRFRINRSSRRTWSAGISTPLPLLGSCAATQRRHGVDLTRRDNGTHSTSGDGSRRP